LPAWRGDWMAAAVVAVGLFPKKAHTTLAIRLNKAYDARLVAEKRGFKFYQRTLLGADFDWVIVSPMGMTFHSKNRSDLIAGLRNKTSAAVLKLPGATRINWSTVRKLGFCESGIRAFCETFGLNYKGEYHPQEIERVVRADPVAAAPFMNELRTLSNAINYRVAEFN
jgi:hypothetical protein